MIYDDKNKKFLIRKIMPRHHNRILYEYFIQNFEIKAYKLSYALNALGKWPYDAR